MNDKDTNWTDVKNKLMDNEQVDLCINPLGQICLGADDMNVLPTSLLQHVPVRVRLAALETRSALLQPRRCIVRVSVKKE